MQHAKDLKRLASEASSKIEKKTNFDEATKLRGMIMSLGLVSRHTFIFFASRAISRLRFKKCELLVPTFDSSVPSSGPN